MHADGRRGRCSGGDERGNHAEQRRGGGTRERHARKDQRIADALEPFVELKRGSRWRSIIASSTTPATANADGIDMCSERGEERADGNAREQAKAAEQERRDGDTGGRPHRRDAAGGRRREQRELGDGPVGRRHGDVGHDVARPK